MLVGAGWKQRTDSTHVIGAVRDLNRLELAGESVRAAVEALAAAAPEWLPTVIDITGWGRRYGARVESWHADLQNQTRRTGGRLRQRCGGAAARGRPHLDTGAPPWLRELPAVDVLRRVLVQNYVITTNAAGREVVRAREADTDGLLPGRTRPSSPYDLDARWAAKGDDVDWNGYKIHLTETCDPPDPTPSRRGPNRRHTTRPAGTPAGRDTGGERPNMIAGVATTDATVPDAAMTEQIHATLARRELLPAEHYLDSGYPSAAPVATACAAGGSAWSPRYWPTVPARPRSRRRV